MRTNPNPITVIALCASQPQSGKDTLADLLSSYYLAKGKKVGRIAFGDALRKHVACIFGVNRYASLYRQLHTKEKDVVKDDLSLAWVSNNYADYVQVMLALGHDLHESRSLRWHMQHYGTDYIRQHRGLENFWVDIVNRDLRHMYDDNFDVVFVTDLRFPLEYEMLGAHHCATFIDVVPVGFPKSLYQQSGTQHVAESHRFDTDITVYNHFGFKENMLKQLVDVGFLE